MYHSSSYKFIKCLRPSSRIFRDLKIMWNLLSLATFILPERFRYPSLAPSHQGRTASLNSLLNYARTHTAIITHQLISSLNVWGRQVGSFEIWKLSEICMLSLTLFIQVNNYKIVEKIFHISHNLTWYSEIVQRFTRISKVCSTYELTKHFIEISVKNCAINLKKNNLYPILFLSWE